LEKRVSLPRVNPACYNALEIALSLLYLYAHSLLAKILLVALILFADWLDGATARQHGTAGSRGGWLVDVITDRASEAFIFTAESDTPVGQVFFLLWVVNCALAFYSAWKNKHSSLALRAAYLPSLLARLCRVRAPFLA